MPTIKIPTDGSIYQIPDRGTYVVETLHRTYATPENQRNRFTFDMDTGWVIVETWEADLPWAFGVASENKEVSWTKKHSRRYPITDYLVGGNPKDSDKSPTGRVDVGNAKWRQDRYIDPESRKTKGEDMDHYPTGTRVSVRSTGEEDPLYGTIVELENSRSRIPDTAYLVCMDKPRPAHYKDYPKTCGTGHGRITAASAITTAGSNFRTTREMYAGVPTHIGMFVPKSFSQQGKTYPEGSSGRVLEMRTNAVRIRWYLYGGGLCEVKDASWVPKESVRWGRIHGGHRKATEWYTGTSRSDHEAGDILIYCSAAPLHIPGTQYVITKGVILEFAGGASDRRHINVHIRAGMDPEIIGYAIKVPKSSVRLFKEPYIPAGEEVEITAEIMFRRKNLRGKRGTVVLATDSEGDVGIEFSEEMEAGSLDGAGTEGKCLYIPADAVNKISE